MLTAEENIVLPLSIAGEKPDKAWLDELIDSRRSRRPPHAPPLGALRRPAAARRDRARARLASPTVVFADEPTGNLDSKTGGEILELLRHSVEELGQTIVMVTHDARAAAIADRILFLADGPSSASSRELRPHEIAAAMEEIGSAVIRFALKGLGGRKLRTALTALAIVLGVAMVSGTFVLTDSIDKAFDAIFTSVYEGTDATITGKSAFDLSDGSGTTAPPFDESLLAEGASAARTSPPRSAASPARRS